MKTETVTYTPGPWEIVNNGKQYYVRRVGAQQGICAVAKICQTHDGADFAWHGNSNLIAAAPELLDACKKLLGAISVAKRPGFVSTEERDNEIMGTAITAIAKAEGRE